MTNKFILTITTQPNLEDVQSAKYLGITITENMDWVQQISDFFFFFHLASFALHLESTKEVDRAV